MFAFAHLCPCLRLEASPRALSPIAEPLRHAQYDDRPETTVAGEIDVSNVEPSLPATGCPVVEEEEDTSAINSCYGDLSLGTNESHHISVFSFHEGSSPSGKLSDWVSADGEEDIVTSAVPTACSSPVGAVHPRVHDSPTDGHFGFFVSIAHSEDSPPKAEDPPVDESVVDYADEHGNPEEQSVPLSVFSAGATTFGYHRARQLQTRLAGIIMTEPSRPPWSNMLL